MDLRELEELFDDDDDEEMMDFIDNLRTYTIRQRPNHLEKWDDKEFFRRFRFSKNCTQQILEDIDGLLRHEVTQYHELDSMAQLLITLRFYATGNFYVSVGDFGGICKTTAGRIISRVTTALVTLRPRYIKMPDTEQEVAATQVDSYRLARFPKVIGAIDCTHIPILSPGGENAEVFRNRKGYFSINVQAVCDSKNTIMDIVARWPGSCHDSHIFNNSRLKQRFENGEFRDSVILGDSGYPLKEYLMTPIPNPHDRAEELYNSSHISTRTVIERTFGILKRRFPILSCKMRCRMELTQKVIIATAILHNIAVKNREDMDIEEIAPDANIIVQGDHPENPDRAENIRRRNYVNYFRTLLR